MEKVDRVINKVITDLGLGQDIIPYADFIEWIADALQHIGSYPQYEQKECMIPITDYAGLLPCDLDHVIRMKNSMEIAPGPSGFYGGSLVNQLNELGIDYESLGAYERFKLIPVPGISKIENQFPTFQDLTNRLSNNGNLIGNAVTNQHTGTDYSLNFNRITTAFCHGIIEIQYMAFAVDERGWPLVPDSVSFRDALFWKCAMQLSLRDPSLLKNPRLQDYEYCRQRWGTYCVQARASANMPDVAMMERMKNNWLSLMPILDRDVNGYAGLGKQQRLNLDGNR